ncbi:unnamed protein product [Plutella xylostella]|uniref:(diamondback moth) hypothetical protein n=1 Tax=Plutella xylostella TaxID=51655 RepID=A0A8S4FUT7_PLUXY|nr:unnamed protein product [Plutella xylostella]
MLPENPLPVILVSACNLDAAVSIMSELVDDKEIVEEESTGGESRVWRLVNKYYTARARVLAQADAAPAPDPALLEAHVVYLTEEECTDSAVGVLEARMEAADGMGEVQLVLAQCAAAGEALAAAAAARGYELVPLRELPDPDEPFPDVCGVQRARAALHAHTWRGLRRAGPAPPARPAPPADDEEAAVERAELFAAALGALGAARDLPPAQRRARAGDLLDTFCRALGLDTHDL